MKIGLAGLALALLLGAGLYAQQSPAPTATPQPATGTITGRLISAATGEGVPGASVGFRCTSPTGAFTGAQTVSDATGHFESVVEPGRCLVLINPPIVDRRPTWSIEELMRPYDVDPGETVRIERRAFRFGSIEGRLVDEQGKPVPFATVCAVRVPDTGYMPCVFGPTLTAADGGFLFDRIGPATYAIVAPAVGIETLERVMPLAAGERKTGVEVRGPRKPVFRLAGQLQAPEGMAAVFPVRLERTDLSIGWMLFDQTVAQADGRFAFGNVPQGSYRLRVDSTPLNPGRDPADVFWGSATVVATRDVGDVAIRMQRGVEVRAEVRVDGQVPLPGRTLSIGFSREVGGTNGMMQVANGQFVTHALAPNRYTVNTDAARIRLNGRAVVEPFEITGEGPVELAIDITNRLTEVTGVVRNAAGVGDGAATAIFVPAEMSDLGNVRVGASGLNAVGSRVQNAPTTQRGAYTIYRLPAGDYLAVAVTTSELRAVPPAEIFNRLRPLATRVTIDGSPKATVDLRTVSIAR